MGMTVVEKILLAAHALEEAGTSPFTAEALIVKAWELDKHLFGLQGYADKYPDSNRVLTNIMGSKGLKAKGWIERVGEKRYQLTATGSRMALRLVGSDAGSATRAGALGRKQVLVVQRMVNSPAFKKTTNAGPQGIIFRDACNFWGISSYSNASTLRNQFTDIREVLEELEKAISQSTTGVIVLPDMKVFLDKERVRAIRETHETLQTKFFNELQVIRGRAAKREEMDEKPG